MLAQCAITAGHSCVGLVEVQQTSHHVTMIVRFELTFRQSGELLETQQSLLDVPTGQMKYRLVFDGCIAGTHAVQTGNAIGLFQRQINTLNDEKLRDYFNSSISFARPDKKLVV